MMSVDTLHPAAASTSNGLHTMGGGQQQQQQQQQQTTTNGSNGNGHSEDRAPPSPNGEQPTNGAASEEVLAEQQDDINITINNTMCTFSVRCHLNLRDIALRGANVEFRKEYQNVLMRLRRPMATATMWSSGKITVTGAPSEELAKIASKKFARQLQKLGYKVRFTRFKVSNVLGTCSLPFGIKLTQFAQNYKEEASYEPELHPGATFKFKHLKASLKVYQTGSVTVTAPSTENVQKAIEEIYPRVEVFRKPKLVSDVSNPIPKEAKAAEAEKKKRKLLQQQGAGVSNGGTAGHAAAAVQQRPVFKPKRRKKAVQQVPRARGDDSDDGGSDPSAESSDE